MVAILAASLLVAGCPDDDTDDDNGDQQDAGEQMDVAPDTEQPDASPQDVAVDAAPDVQPDTAPDVTPDVAPDVAPDVEPDVPASPQQPASANDVFVTEFQANPDGLSDGAAEWVEFYNPSTSTAYELQGCLMLDLGTNSASIQDSVVIQPQGYATVARTDSPGFTPDGTYEDSYALSNSGDEIILECDGTEIDVVNYASFSSFSISAGFSKQLSPTALATADNDTAANWCDTPQSEQYSSDGDGNYGTPGSVNPACATP
jgi:hypothetical protein